MTVHGIGVGKLTERAIETVDSIIIIILLQYIPDDDSHIWGFDLSIGRIDNWLQECRLPFARMSVFV